jgi:hypothetical protein
MDASPWLLSCSRWTTRESVHCTGFDRGCGAAAQDTKRLHTAARNRLTAANAEKQAAFAHNKAVASAPVRDGRQPFEAVLVEAASRETGFDDTLPTKEAPATGVTDDGIDLLLFAMTELELTEQATLSAALAPVYTPSAIPAEVLYPDREQDWALLLKTRHCFSTAQYFPH